MVASVEEPARARRTLTAPASAYVAVLFDDVNSPGTVTDASASEASATEPSATEPSASEVSATEPEGTASREDPATHHAATHHAATLVDLDDDGTELARETVPLAALPAAVALREHHHPRWVWDDTARRYPPLLAAGVRIERCHDLRLCHTILRHASTASSSDLATAPPGPWDTLPAGPPPEPEPSLFELPTHRPKPVQLDILGELRNQLAAVAQSGAPGRLRLLLAAESSGALIATEMHDDGMPWDAVVHSDLLTTALGRQAPGGGRPARLEDLARQIREALDQPQLNPDSAPHLLGALKRAGIPAESTARWELRRYDHPVIAPLLEYKKLYRLYTANGWTWLATWIHDGRFRPEYVVAGVVTGRWATSGGGALQLPASLRAAVRADPGWKLVVADAAQLEPRVLAAMSGDESMARAGREADLYQGVVDAGIVETRVEAKYAMLGAIYGATTGASAGLMPRLAKAYPRAVELVEQAARAGERGEVVSTWLGRTSPPPGASWQASHDSASGEGVEADQVRTARRIARDRGRFTRNFVVQGTAAEWALCWMASLRRRLRDLPGRPHLVYFLHDEVMVHSPAEVADEVAECVRAAAVEAGRLLFGDFPVDFPLGVAVCDSYDEAK